MEKVVEIRPGIQQSTSSEEVIIDEELVKTVETVLADVKSGKLSELAVIGVYSDGRVFMGGGGMSITMIGAVSVLQNYLLHEQMAGN